MRTVKDLEVSYTQFEPPKVKTRPGLFDRLERKKLLVIIFTVAIAFVARAYQLGSQSLAEDEANKIFAIRAYEQGDFTVNTEHPMVMKMLCYVSVHAVAAYNNAIGNEVGLAISEEAALRLPNALFGALTIIPLLLLTNALLGFRVALITSLLWATGIDAIWFSRIVKEDSLLVFFMFSGFYLYHRAKSLPATDIAGQERLYALAGAAFGLMMASKYFPHYFALNALYYTIVGYDSRNNRPLTRRMWGRYFGGLVTAFVSLQLGDIRAANIALSVEVGERRFAYASRLCSNGPDVHERYVANAGRQSLVFLLSVYAGQTAAADSLGVLSRAGRDIPAARPLPLNHAVIFSCD